MIPAHAFDTEKFINDACIMSRPFRTCSGHGIRIARYDDEKRKSRVDMQFCY